MKVPSLSELIDEIIACVVKILKIAKEIIRLIMQPYLRVDTAQNVSAQQELAVSVPSGNDSLPDLSKLGDLEPILSAKEGENVMFDDDDSMVDIEGLNEAIMFVINDDLERS